MNKTQFYTLSGALLASTALSAGNASAGTIGRFAYADNAFTTSAMAIANTIFSTTASTANSVLIGEGGVYGQGFGMRFNNAYAGTTRWTTEFTISGARFVTAGLSVNQVTLLLSTTANTTTVIGSVAGSAACASLTSLVDLLVANDCSITGAATGTSVGISLSGITFNNASGLATVGSSISLTGRIYNPSNPSQTFEASTTGNIITSRAPFAVAVTAGTDKTASATTTPVAFTSLTDVAGNLSMVLATVTLTGTGAFNNGLVSTAGFSTAGTTNISIASSLFSSAAVRSVTVNASVGGSGALSYLTAANFSGGTVTFSATNTTWVAGNSINVVVQFMGTTSIPASVAGTVSGTISGGEQNVTVAGATAAVAQGGFRAEVNTFNASTNGPFGSYLRIHNNGQVSGTVTITVRNDATGEVLGSAYTTSAIAPNSTVQFSALQIETGAAVPTASRTGSYTVSVTGPIIGYVQHILFDGNSVADLSGYRNAGNTTNQP